MWRHRSVMFVPDVIDSRFRCGDGGGNGVCGGGDMGVKDVGIWLVFLVSF